MKGRLFSIHYFTVSPDGLQFLKKPTSNLNAFQTTYICRRRKNHLHTVISLHIRMIFIWQFQKLFLADTTCQRPTTLKSQNKSSAESYQLTYLHLQWILTVDISVAISDMFIPSHRNKFPDRNL